MRIPLSRVVIDGEIEAAVQRVLHSGRYILGDECAAFEAEFAAYIGVEHAVLTASGTAALALTLRGLELPPEAEVLVPALTAFPTVEAILLAGGRPVFVDVDDTATMDLADAARKVTARTVGILPVHLYGHPADLRPLGALAEHHRLWLVEDACQAHGARYRGAPVGGLGRAGCFSFYPSKNLTVLGDGGIITTHDARLAARARRLRDHGRVSKDVHEEVGDNLRFNEIQAAVGRVLLRRLDRGNARRRAWAQRYAARLRGLPMALPSEASWAWAVYHLYVVRTPRRDALRAFLQERGIETGVHYPVPGHRQPAVRHLAPPPLPRTEALADEILSLPMFPDLGEAGVDAVADAIWEFFVPGIVARPAVEHAGPLVVRLAA
jgi:dTDP-4-amino-4,6-dideoxygalactose transaminase